MTYKRNDWVYLKGTKSAGRSWNGLNINLKDNGQSVMRIGDKVQITLVFSDRTYGVQIGTDSYDFREDDLSPTPIPKIPNRLEVLNEKLGGNQNGI